jgi:hypothetical protein
VIDDEQEWIAKFRATLGTPPTKKVTAGTLVASLRGTVQTIISAVGKALQKRTTAPLNLKSFEAASFPKFAEAGTPGQSLQDRSDDPSKLVRGTQPLSGRQRRGKAS